MLWFDPAPHGDTRRDSPNARLVTTGAPGTAGTPGTPGTQPAQGPQGTNTWALVTQNVVAAEAVANRDDFGGIFCATLFSLQDTLAEAAVPVPDSWRPLTDQRDVPAGEAFERSAFSPGLILVDGTPTMALFWHDGAVTAGVVVEGWTAVGFTYPTEFHGRVSLLR